MAHISLWLSGTSSTPKPFKIYCLSPSELHGVQEPFWMSVPKLSGYWLDCQESDLLSGILSRKDEALLTLPHSKTHGEMQTSPWVAFHSLSSLHRGYLHLLLVIGLLSLTLKASSVWGALGRDGSIVTQASDNHGSLGRASPELALTEKGCRRCGGMDKYVGCIPVSGPCVASAAAGS